MYTQGYLSLYINYKPETSDWASRIHWKNPLCSLSNWGLGWLLCISGHVRMCQSGASAKAGLLPPSVFARQPPENAALWRALPLGRRINPDPSLGKDRRAVVGQLAGLWKLLNGELGVLPECGCLVLAVPHPPHIPASCIHLRCLPGAFPGETAASCLRERNTENSWGFKSGGLMQFHSFGNASSI